MPALLAAQEVSKIYQMGSNNVTALDNVSLEIGEGEFVAIQVTSGSGKSTLLNIIGMLDGQDEGEYFFFDEAVHKLKEKHRSQLYKQYIGFVFQAYHLIDELTVY